jgi:hypothetical protein
VGVLLYSFSVAFEKPHGPLAGYVKKALRDGPATVEEIQSSFTKESIRLSLSYLMKRKEVKVVGEIREHPNGVPSRIFSLIRYPKTKFKKALSIPSKKR